MPDDQTQQSTPQEMDINEVLAVRGGSLGSFIDAVVDKTGDLLKAMYEGNKNHGVKTS